jgi:hypothetical protein
MVIAQTVNISQTLHFVSKTLRMCSAMTYDRETQLVRVKYNQNMKVGTDIGKVGKNTTVSRPVGGCRT